MGKSSSRDGRGWKSTGPSSSSLSSSMSLSLVGSCWSTLSPSRFDSAHSGLRPASPPKINPWHTKAKAARPKPADLELPPKDSPLPEVVDKTAGEGQEETASPASPSETCGATDFKATEINAIPEDREKEEEEDEGRPTPTPSTAADKTTIDQKQDQSHDQSHDQNQDKSHEQDHGQNHDQSQDQDQGECKSPPPLSVASAHTVSSAQPETSASRTHRSDSTSSHGSRRVLEAAVPRATENLWVHPFGADVKVVASSMTFMVHREIVTAQSGWFRDNLPPANEDGSAVEVTIMCAPETAAYCLRYMYTHRVDICDESEPSDPAHLPRCALIYCAAVYLRVKPMVAHILRVVENTANDLARTIASRVLLEPDSSNAAWWFDFGPGHIFGALDIVYGQGAQELMRPLRLAMGGILDATVFWLFARPEFVHQLASSREWMLWMPRILADQVEYRQLRERSYSWTGSVITDDAALDTLLADETLRNIVA